MQDQPDTSNRHTPTLVIIERTDGGQPAYLSRKLGRDFGQPNGAWTPDRALATRVTRVEAETVILGMPEADRIVSKAVTP